MTAADWCAHFSSRPDPGFPWRHPDRLTARERARTAAAVQQFQLGEGSDGKGFLARAARDPRVAADPLLVPALRLFIEEEQRHSAWLGRFLDGEGIPRLRHSVLDGVFRWLRKLAGLELCVTVLVTAEILAVPFYQALRDATGSQLLKRICERILCDEAAHLQFQAGTLTALRRSLAPWRRRSRRWLHRFLLAGTTAVLWLECEAVFRDGGYRFLDVWEEAFRELRRLELAVEAGICGQRRPIPANRFRLAD
jgi:hypothetical protein